MSEDGIIDKTGGNETVEGRKTALRELIAADFRAVLG